MQNGKPVFFNRIAAADRTRLQDGGIRSWDLPFKRLTICSSVTALLLGLSTHAGANPIAIELTGLLNSHPQIKAAEKSLQSSRQGVDAAVADAAGVPASSTSIAFVDALRHLGIRRVAVAASYPDDVAQHFVGFLTDGGAEVVSMGSHGIYTAAEVGTLEPSRVVDMVTAADHPDAEAVLVPDTAMHTLAIIDQLEAAVGKPVLTANQVTVWKGLELLGPVPDLPGLGALFRSGSRR